MSDFPSRPIAVTGATGWVGQTALHELQLRLAPDEFLQQVRAYASKSGVLRTTAYGPGHQFEYPIHPLAALPEHAKQEPFGHLFHAAFFPRSGLAAVGVDAYISINRDITRWVCEAILHSPDVRVVNISSGAAAAYDASPPGSDDAVAENPYGALKYEEEGRIGELTDALILRIYTLSGRFMSSPEIYALGDFLLAAREKRQIILKAKNRVVRGFGHAGNITAAAWAWLNSDHPAHDGPLATVSVETDLQALAQRISTLFHLPEPVASVDMELPPNVYSSESAPFLAFLSTYGLNALTLDDQIADTAKGLDAPLPADAGSRSHPA